MGLMSMTNALKLRPIVDLSKAEQLKLLSIRNQTEVRRNMYTSHEIAEEEHFGWLERIAVDQHTRVFAVFLDEELIGAVSLNAISEADRRADWAFYLSASIQGGGVGAALEFKFLDYAFETLNKLNCEVLDFNEPVIRMHKKFGFKHEGTRRHHILRKDQYQDMVLLGITAEEWLESREKLVKGAFRE